MSYANTFVRFERVGDKVTPVRVRKEWVTTKRGRKFVTTRLSEVPFGRPEPALDAEGLSVPWSSTPPPALTTRESLLAAGLLAEPGHDEPFLPMGSPPEWSWAVANNPDSWEMAA